MIFLTYSKCFTIPFSSCHGDLGFFSTVNQDGFKPNLETHLIPLMAMKMEDNSMESKNEGNDPLLKDALHPLLKQVLFSRTLTTIKYFLICREKRGRVLSRTSFLENLRSCGKAVTWDTYFHSLLSTAHSMSCSCL